MATAYATTMPTVYTSAEQRDGVTVLAVRGEIDMASAPTLEAAVAGELVKDPHALIIDLTEVEFLGLVGLRILATARHKIGESARFAVAAQGLVTKIIRLVRLDGFLSLHESLEDALLAAKKSKTG